MLAGNLTEAGARAAREVAARLGTRLVRAADELPRFEAKGSAMTLRHSHERAIAVEPNELLGALTETLVVVAGHAHIRLEPREAACAAGETFWNRLHFESAPTVRYTRRVCDLGFPSRGRASPGGDTRAPGADARVPARTPRSAARTHESLVRTRESRVRTRESRVRTLRSGAPTPQSRRGRRGAPHGRAVPRCGR
jgi:hypothetical protein